MALFDNSLWWIETPLPVVAASVEMDDLFDHVCVLWLPPAWRFGGFCRPGTQPAREPSGRTRPKLGRVGAAGDEATALLAGRTAAAGRASFDHRTIFRARLAF